ncbi:MAG: hypothetical protein KJ950_14565 [Proteobacteria bacterium]|nr:hypothetical protein [Pseudomonadota bacterium]MBU1688991.1 hypothetical protein [Pseudomonadota bacterium]
MAGNIRGKTEIPFRDGFYRGEMRDGLPNGVGTYSCESFTYTGSWFYGTMSGLGVMRYADGRLYKGEFYADQRHGQGTEVIEVSGVKSRYEGGWRNNQKHGKGIEISIIAGVEIRHEGEWKNNVKYGAVIQSLEDTGLKSGLDSDRFKNKKVEIYNPLSKE